MTNTFLTSTYHHDGTHHPTSNEIESKLQQFSMRLEEAIQHNIKSPETNLSKLQHNCLQNIKYDHIFIICLSDKNLGPAIMNTLDYINLVLKEYLLTKTYRQLSPTEAKKINSTKKDCILSTAQQTFFQRSFKNNHRLPLFYGVPKAHKTH